jgi:CDGSH-type Zn-finger protein
MSGEAFSLKTKEPVVAQYGPYAVEVEKGKTYYWCRCGLSKNQPFCTYLA